jgi:hypothetical protein
MPHLGLTGVLLPTSAMLTMCDDFIDADWVILIEPVSLKKL